MTDKSTGGLPLLSEADGVQDIVTLIQAAGLDPAQIRYDADEEVLVFPNVGARNAALTVMNGKLEPATFRGWKGTAAKAA